MRNEPARTDGTPATATSRRSSHLRFARRLRSYVIFVPLVALAAACGGGDDEAAPQPPPSAVEQSVPTSGSVGTQAPGRGTATTGSRPTVTEPAAPTIANGTHSIYLTGVDTGRRTISVDVVQVIDRRSAEAATVCPELAAGDHDGYCIKNVNGQLRTVPVDAKASLQVLSGSSLRSVDMSGLAAAREGQKEDNFFQITVAGGKVTAAKELYRA